MSDTNTEKKSSLVDWGTIPEEKERKSGGGSSGVNWLRLKSGGNVANEYVVRLFHKPKELHRYYNPKNNKTALTDDPDNCPIKLKGYKASDGKLLRPKLRYAINVIDRAEPGKVKIMEGPKSVFTKFREFYENIGIDPGGKDACDFTISVSGIGIDTTYKVTYKVANKKAFTSEEREMLTEHKYDLDKVFYVTAPDKIEEALGLTGAASTEATEPENVPEETATPAPVGATKSAGKDDFDWSA
jgi:hypothetical protein